MDFGGGALNDRPCSLNAGSANALEYTNSQQTNIQHHGKPIFNTYYIISFKSVKARKLINI